MFEKEEAHGVCRDGRVWCERVDNEKRAVHRFEYKRFDLMRCNSDSGMRAGFSMAIDRTIFGLSMSLP